MHKKIEEYQQKLYYNKKYNNYMPILLWLFPLLLFNIGWIFHTYMVQRWEEQELVELSKQEVETLSAKSEFSSFFSSSCGKFFNSLKSEIDIYVDSGKNTIPIFRIENISNSVFEKSFPEHEMYVFKIASDTTKANVLFKNNNKIEDEVINNTFEYLVKLNSKSNIENDNKDIKLCFNNNIEVSLIASQNSEVTYASFNGKQGLFFWNYFFNANLNEIFGFFVFVDKGNITESTGRLLAIEELDKKQSNVLNQKYGAFIPLFPDCGGIVASTELNSNRPDLKQKLEDWSPKNIKELFNWQKNDSPLVLGNNAFEEYRVFFNVAPKQTHAAVLFVPFKEKDLFPIWLIILNIIFLSIIIIVLFRGLVLGIWPQISLKVRFFTTYFLAACLPLGLMIISSFGYISEYKHTNIFRTLSNLKIHINEFDINKTKAQDEYRTVFLEIQNDSEIIDSLKNISEKTVYAENGISDDSKNLISRILNKLNKENHRFPIIGFSIINEKGECLANIGNDFCPYYKSVDGKELFSQNYDYVSNSNKELFKEDSVFINSYLKSILDEKIDNSNIDNHIKKSNNKEILNNYFRNNLIQDNFIFTKTNGSNSYGIIQNSIYIDGVPKFIIGLYWDENDLDEKTYISTVRKLYINSPSFIFTAFEITSQGITPKFENFSRHGLKFSDFEKDFIKQAYFRKSAVSIKNSNYSIVAVPSKKYKDLVIVGSAIFNNDMEIFWRFWICIIIILIALITFFACIHYSRKIFLKPIFKLKNLLDKISEGNYDIEIKSNSNDEIGLMCKEFNKMTKELSEREKLATLISDHAVEALSKNEITNENIDVESFKGTVLVSDIRNFTGMCEIHSPDNINDLLNNHFSLMTKIVSSNGGRIYKYIGDAIVVIFADKDEEKNSAERAFLSVCEMLNALKNINEKRKNQNLFEYRIGIGLCYGNMSSGTIGSIETRLDYAIIGDVINIASKLESASVCNPDFPIIVDKSFTERFRQVYDNIEFIPIKDNNDIEGYKLPYEVYELFLKKISENGYITTNDSSVVSNDNEVSVYEIEENLSFKQKIIPGSIFVIILAIIMALGIYFVFNTAHNNEKIPLKITNDLELEQITGEQYGKTVFDIKCRDIVLSLKKDFDKREYKDINEEYIEKKLNEILMSEKSLNNINVNHLFIKVNDFAGLNTNDKTFIDKISLKTLANKGYSDNEVIKISECFKLIIGLDYLDKITNKLYLSKSDSESFKQASILYMKEKYPEPSTKVFGNKITMSVFKNNAKNASVNGEIAGKDSYIFWLDFYKKEKLIGYLIISMYSKEIDESIPVLLNAFSKDGALISLKNKNTNEWYFSDNVSKDTRNAIISVENNNKSNEDDIKYKGNEYLLNLLGVTNKRVFNISDTPYDIYITRLCTLNKGNPANALFWVFVIITAISITLWKISKGISRINSFIEAKLWVALLTVAVIPVITVFFVFGLFRNEYYFVKSNVQRDNMQSYCDSFEEKKDFSSPLIWNYIKNKNKSEKLADYIYAINSDESGKITENKDNVIRLIKSWIDEQKPWEKLDCSMVNFKVENVYVYSDKGWNLNLKDRDNYLSSSYLINLNNDKFDFNNIIKELSFNIFNNIKGTEKNKCLNINQDSIFGLFGKDKYLKIVHNLNNPVYINIGNDKYGFLFNTISTKDDYNNLIIWVIKFDDFETLLNLTKEIKTDYKIYFTDKEKYGQIYDDNLDDLRIIYGKYAGWLAFSNLPVSIEMKINKDSYFIEGKSSSDNDHTIILTAFNRKNTLNEINLFSLCFYILLGISLLIISNTTRNIADDMIYPINRVMEGIKEVGKENFSYRINFDRKDELGDLCSSFDKMIKGLDEKRMMSKMLSNTAKLVTLREGDSSIKTDSVLFYVGIPNFTDIIKELKDFEVFQKLSEQTTLVANIIMEESGEVDKIIGEKLLAVFPIKEDKSLAAKNACMAAKRLLEYENSNKLPFAISIGINYGNVINGLLGIGNKRDFTVIGDAVNVTARIESVAEKLKKDRCLISEPLYNFVDKAFKADEYGKVELKGKSQPMKVYQLK